MAGAQVSAVFQHTHSQEAELKAEVSRLQPFILVWDAGVSSGNLTTVPNTVCTTGFLKTDHYSMSISHHYIVYEGSLIANQVKIT